MWFFDWGGNCPPASYGHGDVLPRFGILKNSPKTVKCVINFATDCSPGSKRKKHAQLSDLVPLCTVLLIRGWSFKGLKTLAAFQQAFLPRKNLPFFSVHTSK